MRVERKTYSPVLECPFGFDFSLLVSSQVDYEASPRPQESDVGQKVASLSAQCHNHEGRLAELTILLQKLQMRVDQVDNGREGMSLWVKDVVGQHLQEMGTTEPLGAKVKPRNSFRSQCAHCSQPVWRLLPVHCDKTPHGTNEAEKKGPEQDLPFGHIPGAILPLAKPFRHCCYHCPVVSAGDKSVACSVGRLEPS